MIPKGLEGPEGIEPIAAADLHVDLEFGVWVAKDRGRREDVLAAEEPLDKQTEAWDRRTCRTAFLRTTILLMLMWGG